MNEKVLQQNVREKFAFSAAILFYCVRLLVSTKNLLHCKKKNETSKSTNGKNDQQTVPLSSFVHKFARFDSSSRQNIPSLLRKRRLLDEKLNARDQKGGKLQDEQVTQGIDGARFAI
jgi:hypothetical protein